MAIQTLNTIKNWFKTSLKPSQQEFWDTWDSFRHKLDKVPVKDVDGIENLLDEKADKSNLKTINGKSIVGSGNIFINDEDPDLQTVLSKGSTATDIDKTFIQTAVFEVNSQGLGAPNSISINKGESSVIGINSGSGGVEITSTGGNIEIGKGGTQRINIENRGSFQLKTEGQMNFVSNSGFDFRGNNVGLTATLEKPISMLSSDNIVLGSNGGFTLLGAKNITFRVNPSINTTNFSLPTEKPSGNYIVATTDDIPDSNNVVHKTGNEVIDQGKIFRNNLEVRQNDLNAQNYASYSWAGPHVSTQSNEGMLSDYWVNLASSSGNFGRLTADNLQFGNSNSTVSILPSLTASSINLILPSTSGQLALISDIPSIPSLQQVVTNDPVISNGQNIINEFGANKTTISPGVITIIEKGTFDKYCHYGSREIQFFDANGNHATIWGESGNGSYFLPNKVNGNYTFATTDDFKTINGQSIVGTGNITIAESATSGTYTPEFSDIYNIENIFVENASWTKIGNIVTVRCSLEFKFIEASKNSSLCINVPFNIDSSSLNLGIGNMLTMFSLPVTGVVQRETNSKARFITLATDDPNSIVGTMIFSYTT